MDWMVEGTEFELPVPFLSGQNKPPKEKFDDAATARAARSR